MPSMSPRQRLLASLRFLLQRRRSSTAALAAQLGVSKDVAREDLALLEEGGWVRALGSGRDRDYQVDPLQGLGQVDLYDALALRIGRETCDFLAETPLAQTLVRAERSSQGALERHLARLPAKVVCLQEPARRYDQQREIIDELLEGLLGEREVLVSYRERAPVTYQPLTLVIYRRALYLLARKPGEAAVQRLAVHRMVAVERGAPFTWPEDWDPRSALAPWFGVFAAGPVGPVVLRFDAAKADLVLSRAWHPSQQISTLADGRVELRFFSGGPELVRFVLEWGPTVEVVGPPWLRQQVVDQLRAALARYDDPLPGPGPLL